MTAHPHYDESRERPLRIAVALVLVIVVVLAVGCTGITESTGSCPYPDYQPVLLLGDNGTTRFLGHETKPTDPGQAWCTEFNASYSDMSRYAPRTIKKFDFVEFDQERLLQTIRQDQQIDVWIRGEKHNVSLKLKWPSSQNILIAGQDPGFYSYSGSFDGTYENNTVLTISNRTVMGSVTWGLEAFYIQPVGSRTDASGNISFVHVIYSQRDLEDGGRIDLSNDVLTPPTTPRPKK
jgi:hypothetical protein